MDCSGVTGAQNWVSWVKLSKYLEDIVKSSVGFNQAILFGFDYFKFHTIVPDNHILNTCFASNGLWKVNFSVFEGSTSEEEAGVLAYKNFLFLSPLCSLFFFKKNRLFADSRQKLKLFDLIMC